MITLQIKFNDVHAKTYKYIINFLNKYEFEDAFFFYLNFRIFFKAFANFYPINDPRTWQYIKKTRLVLYCFKGDAYNKELNSQFYLVTPWHTDPRWYIPLNWVTRDIVYMDNVYKQTKAANGIFYRVFSIQKTALTKIIEQPDNDPFSAPKLALSVPTIASFTFVDLQTPINLQCANCWQGVLYQANYPPGVSLSFSQRVPLNIGPGVTVRYNGYVPNADITISEHPFVVPFVEFCNTGTVSTYRGYTAAAMTNFKAFLIKYPILGNRILRKINAEPLYLKAVDTDDVLENTRFDGVNLIPDKDFFVVPDVTYLYYDNPPGTFSINYSGINFSNPEIKWSSLWHSDSPTGAFVSTTPTIGYRRYYNFSNTVKNEQVFILANDIQAISIFNKFNLPNYYNDEFRFSVSKHEENISTPLSNSNYYTSQPNYISDAANSIVIYTTIDQFGPSPYTKTFYLNTALDVPYSWPRYSNLSLGRDPTYMCELETMIEGIRALHIPDKLLCNTKFITQATILFQNIEIVTDNNGLFVFKPLVNKLNFIYPFRYIGIRTYAFKTRPRDLNGNTKKTDPFYNWTVKTPLANHTITVVNDYPILNISNTFENATIFYPISSLDPKNFVFYINTIYKNTIFFLNIQLFFTF